MNKTLFARIGLVALIMLGYAGLNVAFNPSGILELFELTVTGVDSNIGLRADISGMFVGTTVLLALGLLQSKGSWIWSAAVIISSVLVVRIYGVFVYGYTQEQGVILAIEIVMIAIMVFATRTFDSDS